MSSERKDSSKRKEPRIKLWTPHMQSVCPDNSNPADTENVKKRPNKIFLEWSNSAPKLFWGRGLLGPNFNLVNASSKVCMFINNSKSKIIGE